MHDPRQPGVLRYLDGLGQVDRFDTVGDRQNLVEEGQRAAGRGGNLPPARPTNPPG